MKIEDFEEACDTAYRQNLSKLFTEPIFVRPIQSVLKLLKFHLKKFDSKSFKSKLGPRSSVFEVKLLQKHRQAHCMVLILTHT